MVGRFTDLVRLNIKFDFLPQMWCTRWTVMHLANSIWKQPDLNVYLLGGVTDAAEFDYINV